MRGGAFFNGNEGRDDFRKTALRAVTSFPFQEGKAWLECGALLAGETER